jgi:hypothetical protein
MLAAGWAVYLGSIPTYTVPMLTYLTQPGQTFVSTIHSCSRATRHAGPISLGSHCLQRLDMYMHTGAADRKTAPGWDLLKKCCAFLGTHQT